MKTFSTLNHLVPACVLALATLGAAPPSTAAANAPPGLAETPTVVAQAQAGRYGPYATIRRANEVAAWFRQQGFSAVAFHNGDGYYVDVR